MQSKDHETRAWTFKIPKDVFKNEALSDALYEAASRRTWFDDVDLGPPLTGWRWLKARARNFLVEWWPTFHFGPCDHSECE